MICAIAWRQAAIGDGTFSDQFGHGITISLHTVILIDGGVVLRERRCWCRACSQDEWFFAPQLALWFVGLLAQYYLLFPVLFWLMRRIGVVRVPRADVRASPSGRTGGSCTSTARWS